MEGEAGRWRGLGLSNGWAGAAAAAVPHRDTRAGEELVEPVLLAGQGERPVVGDEHMLGGADVRRVAHSKPAVVDRLSVRGPAVFLRKDVRSAEPVDVLGHAGRAPHGDVVRPPHHRTEDRLQEAVRARAHLELEAVAAVSWGGWGVCERIREEAKTAAQHVGVSTHL